MRGLPERAPQHQYHYGELAMLGGHEIPYVIRSSEDGLYGDVEAFLRSYEAGEQAAHWDHCMRHNAVSEDQKVACFVTSSVSQTT